MKIALFVLLAVSFVTYPCLLLADSGMSRADRVQKRMGSHRFPRGRECSSREAFMPCILSGTCPSAPWPGGSR